MSVTVNIEEVTAPDASEHVAPHKISKKATKNSLTVKFKLSASGPIGAWRTRLEPSNRNTGTLLAKAGMVCGSGDRCGNSQSLSVPTGTQVTETITSTLLGEAVDGGHEVKVFACSDGEGWST